MSYLTFTGRNDVVRILYSIFPILFLGLLSGCAQSPKSLRALNEKALPPEYFQLQLEVKESIVRRHKLMDTYIVDQVPDLRFSHKGLYQGELVLVFRSNRFHGSQWLAKVPFRYVDDQHEINGKFVIEAIRYDRSLASGVRRWAPPPVMIRWQVVFHHKRIIEQSILRPKVEWGEFHFLSKDTSAKVVTLNNPRYDGCIWKGRYGEPGVVTGNGKIVIAMKLMNHDCFPRKN